LIGILEKYPGYSKNGQGSIWNYVYMVGGLIIKNRKKEGFFCKKVKRVGGPF
jgi:hypothetical protein